jgi:Fe-S-cluster containining protein
MTSRKGKRKKRNGPAPIHKARRPAARDAQGRLHLTVQQDPSSGATKVGLLAPLFTEDWQNSVAASAASTAHLTLSGGVDAARVVQLARQAMAATSQLADGLLARAANGTVACKPGCDHCCYQSVGVTTPEALAIVEHLRQTLSEQALGARAEHIRAARERTRGLSSAERYSPEHPCPFLEQGQCSIYEVRPLSCRGMNSLDAEECRNNLRDPKARAAFLETGAGTRSFMEPIRAFHAVSAGLQLSLSELFGLDMRPLDLTAAMHELLSDTGSITEQWLAGKSPLEAARGGDSSDSETIRELSGRFKPRLTPQV